MESVFGDLFRLIMQGARRGGLSDAFSRVSFINFNYDRALEQFLRRGLVEHFGVPEAEAVQLVSELTVLHPYGSLGNLHGPEAVGFGSRLEDVQLRSIAARIQTFSEQVASDTGEQIKKLVASAKHLIFLGCAHHPQNMRLLEPDTSLQAAQVYGTIYMPPPVDPAGYATPSMPEFATPTIAAFKRNIIRWGSGPIRDLHLDNCHVDPLSNRQLIARYQSSWTDTLD